MKPVDIRQGYFLQGMHNENKIIHIINTNTC